MAKAKKESIAHKVVEIIETVILPPVSLTIVPTHRLQADLHMDSLDACEIVLSLEEEFDIVIPEEVWEKKEDGTVQEVISYVQKRCGEKA